MKHLTPYGKFTDVHYTLSGSAWNYFRQFVSDSDFVESNMIYGISFILEVV